MLLIKSVKSIPIKKIVILKEKFVSSNFYPKLQAELKICNFIFDWNDRSKFFRCKKYNLPLVMEFIKKRIAEYQDSLGEQ